MGEQTIETKLRRQLYSFIIARCRRLVQLSGLKEPPFLPQVMAQVQGVRVAPTLLGPSLSALLIPIEEGGFIARVNSAHTRERQNFSLAHEIGHTFLMEPDASQVVDRLIGIVGIEEYTKFEETLCHLAASELLMPYYVFRQCASQYDFSVDAVGPLSDIFATSATATAVSIGQVSPRPCHVILWKHSVQSTPERPTLRVSWATSSKTRVSEGRSSFIALSMLTDKTSSIFEAYTSEGPIHSYEYLPLKGFRGLCNIQSQAFGRGEYRYVVSLVFPHDTRE